MAEVTSDGLALSEDIFNMPLTVKVELPDSWGRITYRQAGGKVTEAYAFEEGGINFVYIDLIPNGGEAYLENAGDPTEYVKSLGMKQNTNVAASVTYNIYIPEGSLVESVYVGKRRIEPVPVGNGMLEYSVGDIDITDIGNKLEWKLEFKSESGLSNYKFKRSVVDYFADLVKSSEAGAAERQLAFDFLTYARESIIRFTPEDETAYTGDIDEILGSMEGYSLSSTDRAAEDIGDIGAVISGITFAINEKPYYLFYIRDDFTGNVELTLGDGQTVKYEIVNGYYHCTHQLIHEVPSVASLTEALSVRLEGTVNGRDISIEGKYSLVNYVEGTGTDYSRAIMAYALSSYSYLNGK